MLFSNPTTGRMPREKNEIATDTTVLDLLVAPHEIGQKINIENSVGEEKNQM